MPISTPDQPVASMSEDRKITSTPTRRRKWPWLVGVGVVLLLRSDRLQTGQPVPPAIRSENRSPTSKGSAHESDT